MTLCLAAGGSAYTVVLGDRRLSSERGVEDDEFPKVLATDDADPSNSDIYTISAQPYPPDPRWYLGGIPGGNTPAP